MIRKNEGVVDDMVLVKLEDLPQKYMRIVNIPAGETITVPIMINYVANLNSCQISLTYNPSVVQVTGITEGDLELSTNNINNNEGWMTAITINEQAISGNLVFAYIDLTAVSSNNNDSSLLDITVDQLIGNGNPISYSVIDGTFTVSATAHAVATVDKNRRRGISTSGEQSENIAITEIEWKQLSKDSEFSYGFDSPGNIVRNINIKSLDNSGQIAAKIEILKDTSTLIDTTPPDNVYMNLNIMLGYNEWGSSKNIANPEIYFEVEKSWVTANNIDETTIKMYRYNGGKWNVLDTSITDQDSDKLYLKAKTSEVFTSFAVTGKELTGEAGAAGIEVTGTDVSEIETEQTQEKPGLPGFGLFVGISALLISMRIIGKRR